MARASIVFCLFALTGLAGCAEPPVPSRVEVSPSIARSNVVGLTIQFTARVIDDEGNEIVGAAITWSSSSTEVATVSASGLVTVTGQGSATIRAVHQGVSGAASVVVELEPARLARVAGDGQTAPALSILPEDPTVRVEDAGGAPIPNVRVEFDVLSGGGQVVPLGGLTDTSGEVSTRWTLGEPAGTQVLRATAAGRLETLFTVTATEPLLAIRTMQLGRARVDVAYREALEVIGGEHRPLSWSVTEGALPSGLMLDTAGVIAGTTTAEGASTFMVHVRDTMGNEASRELSLRVCKPPLHLQSGEFVVMNPAGLGTCPPFLPAGASGDRYRIGVVRPATSTNGGLVPVTVTVTESGAEAGPALARMSPSRPSWEIPPALADGIRVADASARLHARLLAEAERLIQRLGPGAVLPDTRTNRGRGAFLTARPDPPPERMTFRPYDSDGEACSPPGPNPAPAHLVGYNDHLAVYQDSVQRVTDSVRTADVRQVLDYYDAYGAETIAEYFGGVSDINGDERVNVFISPTVGDDFAAFVWPGDFLDAAQCTGSNQMELVYFNESMFHAVGGAPDDGHYQALPTMVHEVKHVSSLYRRSSAGSFHPSWIEEGTAEIAAEISSRRAMEAIGGVARGALLTREHYPPRDGSIISPENYGMLLRLARTIRSYSRETNSLVGNPTEDHTYYGTSWHFHRFLGDAYGDAADKADGPFFLALNDTTGSAGVAGIREATGKSVDVLLEEYTAAMLLNGTGAPEPERTFTTYDFPSATFQLYRPNSQPEGLYPWPHTGPEPVVFGNATYAGDLASAGIRFHDFESDGAGDGIEVEVSATAGSSVRVVIVRLR